MIEKLLTPNKWSRSQRKIREHRAIALHWYLKAGQSARGAVAYWELRKEGDRGYGAGHVALDDDNTLLVIPTDEVAYHAGAHEYTEFSDKYLEGDPNYYSLAIEMAHDDMTGRPSPKVWERAIEVAVQWCGEFAIPVHMIVTHWDLTGMQDHWGGHPCHKWFVENPGELARFQAEVKERV